VRRRAREARGAAAVQGLLRWNYDRMRAALGGLPREMPRQEELRALAAPYYTAG
jgi:hypothetical protein